MTGSRNPLDMFAAAMASRGLDLVGVCSKEELISNAETAARAFVVIGSGGRAHWEALGDGDEPHPDPLDRHATRAIQETLGSLPESWHSKRLSLDERDRLDLRHIAERAGFGHFSPHLEMLIHPVFGPWIAIRAVVEVEVDLESTPLEGPHPCDGCERPCLSACPVDAYGPGHPFDVARCAEHRFKEDAPPLSCAGECRSRSACIIGPEHRYGEKEMRHRHRASLGILRAFLG